MGGECMLMMPMAVQWHATEASQKIPAASGRIFHLIRTIYGGEKQSKKWV